MYSCNIVLLLVYIPFRSYCLATFLLSTVLLYTNQSFFPMSLNFLPPSVYCIHACFNVLELCNYHCYRYCLVKSSLSLPQFLSSQFITVDRFITVDHPIIRFILSIDCINRIGSYRPTTCWPIYQCRLNHPIYLSTDSTKLSYQPTIWLADLSVLTDSSYLPIHSIDYLPNYPINRFILPTDSSYLPNHPIDRFILSTESSYRPNCPIGQPSC